MISKKYIIIFVLLLVGSVIFVLNGSDFFGFNPSQNHQNDLPNIIENQENSYDEIDLLTKEGLLSALKEAGEKEDYQGFTEYLKMVYQKQWDTDEDFAKAESQVYMKVTENYFDKGDVNKTLEISNMVYKEVPQGWRFRYLRIRCLEKLGREAFEKGDLNEAENYAMEILHIMYRREGADLLADIYIKKIEENLAKENKEEALKNLNFIWDYEVSQDRRDRLIELRNQTIERAEHFILEKNLLILI